MRFISIIRVLVIFWSAQVSADLKKVESLISENKSLSVLAAKCPHEIYKGPEAPYQDFIDLCSTKPELCLESCLSGSANHCVSLGHHMQFSGIETNNPDKLFSKACSLGSITACTNLAAGLMRSEPDNHECFTKSFELTCSKEDAWGCTMYGFLLARGIGIEKNISLAKQVLKVGCKHGIEDDACKNALAIEKEIDDVNGAN